MAAGIPAGGGSAAGGMQAAHQLPQILRDCAQTDDRIDQYREENDQGADQDL